MKPHAALPSRPSFPPIAPHRFIEPLEARIAPAVVVLNVGSLANDADGDGVADPGDRIHYTVTVQNTGPGDVTGLTFQEILNNPALALVANSINVSPLAFNDSYTAVGNTMLRVGNPAATTGPAATNATKVLANDTEFLGDSFVISAFDATSVGGGALSMVTSGADAGSFSYLPAVGFTGVDTFTYTLRDDGIDNIAGNADDLTGVGTVTITVASKVWYVDNTAPAGGSGRSDAPFDSLASVTGAAGPDAAGDIIFVRTGSGNYTGGVALLNNQTLWGENQELFVGGLTLQAAGTDPVITNTGAGNNGVTLASGNTLKGFTVGDTGGFDIANTTTATVGALTISNVVLNGTGGLFRADSGGTLAVTLDSAGTTSATGNGIHLAGATSGSFTVSAGAISGVAGTDVLISGGTATVSIAASIASSAGGSVEIASHGTNNVTLSGALNITGGTGVSVHDNTGGTIAFTNASKVVSTGAGAAVTLTNNTGATIHFTGGGLDIDTSTATGFNATGGGTISVQGAGNTIDVTSGSGLVVASTTIGAGNLNFQRVSVGTVAGSAGVGISLDTTGSTGGLIVTGTGTAGSGGTIQHKTGADGSTVSGIGIYLSNTRNVSLDRMQLNHFDNFGILGLNVTNFTLTNTVVSGSSGTNDAIDEGPIAFGRTNPGGVNGLQGTGTFTNVTVSGAVENGLQFWNQSGSMNVTFTNLTSNDTKLSPTGADGMLIEMQGTATATVNIVNSTFMNNFTQGVQAAATDTATLNVIVTGSTFSGNNEGIVANHSGSSDLTATIGGDTLALGNTFTNHPGASIVVSTGSTGTATASLTAKIKNNNVTSSASAVNHSIIAFVSGTATPALLNISNNTVNHQAFGHAILVDTPDAASSPQFAVTANNNNVTNNAPGGHGVLVQARQNSSGIAHMEGNTGTVDPASSEARVRQNGAGATLQLERGVSSSSDPLVVMQANHPGLTVTTAGTVTVVNNGTFTPLPLYFAPETVEDSSPPPVVTTEPVVVAPPGDPTPPVAQPPVIVDDGILSQAELDSLVAAAIARWTATGLSAAQVLLLEKVIFTIEDLPGWYLGSAGTGVVTLDVNAAGNQWFVDLTPLEDEEWSGDTPVAIGPTGPPASLTPAPATGVSPLHARVDALTTILHEFGHQLGLDDTYFSADSANLMYGWLTAGERRLPAAGQATGVVAGLNEPGHSGPDFLFGAMNLGTLPNGKTLTIVYDATINNLTNGLAPVINSQVRILGTGVNVLSDDPALGGAADPTVTLLDTLTLGGTTWSDLNKDGDLDAGEPGVDAVVVNLFADTNADGSFTPGTDTFVASTTTAGGGLYSFANLLPGEYLVQVAQSNLDPGGALAALTLSSPGAPDPDNNLDDDDNGAPLAGQGVVSAAITLAYNAEPTAGLGNDTNNTLDFGFFAPVVDLQITKTDGKTDAVPGAQNTYTIVVTNAGPDTANGATVADTFAAAFIGATWTAELAGGATGNAAGAGNISETVNVPAGATVTYTVTGTVDPAATGSLANTATVAPPAGVSDTNNTNDSATDTDTLTPQADLTITKTDNRTTVAVGFPNTYTIVVRNIGPSDATGATVADLFSADFAGVTWSTAVTGGATATANGMGDINDTVNLPAGSTITYTVNGTVGFNKGILTNTATVTAPGAVTEIDPANNTATDESSFIFVPDLSVTIDDAVNATTPGAALTYTVGYANGPTIAEGVVISVPLPVGTTFTAADNAGWTRAGGKLKFDLGDLAAAANGNATLKLKVKDPVPVGQFAITATATIGHSGDDPGDVNPADNTDTDIDALPPLQLANGGKSALYLDVDGDLVTVKTTKGTFELTDFTIRAAGLGIVVERLLLAGDPDFGGTKLTWTAKPQPGNRGDGMVNVGAIDAAGLDLVGVTIPGDLGQIDAGSGVAKPVALGSLAVQSLGRFGLDTQNAGLTPSLESTINGPLGKLSVKTDIDGAFIDVTGANGTVGSVNVGRSLVGGAANNSGLIQSAQNMGAVKIGGNLLGGVGAFSGAVHSLTNIKSVSVGGALLGGAGANSASIVGDASLGAVSVKSDVRGGGMSAGSILSNGAIKSVVIGGSLIGGLTLGGSVASIGGAIGSVAVSNNLEGGAGGATGILAATTLGAVKIGGGVSFGLGFSEAPLIAAGGVLNPANATAALAIKSVSIGGSVHGFNLLAGFDTTFTPINADASIGAVSVKGDWNSANLIAGIAPGGDGMSGTDDDFVFNAGGDPEILASVASVSIGGVARGATGGPLAFLAEKFGAFKTGATAFPLTAGFDDLIVGTNGIRMRELNAATAPDPLVNPTIPVSVLEFFNGNKTATFTDLDGDLVTIKTSKGDLSLGGVLTFGTGGNGGQLQLINLAALFDFEGANLTITAKRTDAGGNGFVDIGAIFAPAVNLGHVRIAGDLGQIDAGTADPVKPAIASLTVQSLGAAGLETQGGVGNLRSETRGALGKLVVKTDVVLATLHVGGGLNGATNDGPLGKLGSVSISRSLIGGADDTGLIEATGTMGKVTIGGDVRGSAGDRSGLIRATSALGDVSVGGSLLGGAGMESGSILGLAGVGNVSVKQSLRGGSDDRAGSILALGGNLKGVKIGGHLVGGADDFTGSILAAAGAVGKVTIAGSLLAFADDRTGIFSDTTLGAIKIGGDVLGGNGFTAKISAEGIAAPASAAKAVAIKSLDIGGVTRFARVLAGFDVNGNAANPDVQIGSVKVKGDWIAGDIAAGVDPTNPHFGDGDDASILAGGNAAIASRIGAIVIAGQAAGTFAAGDSFAFTAQQLGSVKVGKSAFKLGKKATDPLDHIAIGITLDLAAREIV